MEGSTKMKTIIRENWKPFAVGGCIALMLLLFTAGGCGTVRGFASDLDAASRLDFSVGEDSE